MRRTLRQQAARTGLSLTSLRRAIARNELEHTRLSDHGWVYVTDAAIDQWIAAHTVPASAGTAPLPQRRRTAPASSHASVPRESALL